MISSSPRKGATPTYYANSLHRKRRKQEIRGKRFLLKIRKSTITKDAAPDLIRKVVFPTQCKSFFYLRENALECCGKTVLVQEFRHKFLINDLIFSTLIWEIKYFLVRKLPLYFTLSSISLGLPEM
jgi:hypothetical protein